MVHACVAEAYALHDTERSTYCARHSSFHNAIAVHTRTDGGVCGSSYPDEHRADVTPRACRVNKQTMDTPRVLRFRHAVLEGSSGVGREPERCLRRPFVLPPEESKQPQRSHAFGHADAELHDMQCILIRQKLRIRFL